MILLVEIKEFLKEQGFEFWNNQSKEYRFLFPVDNHIDDIGVHVDLNSGIIRFSSTDSRFKDVNLKDFTIKTFASKFRTMRHKARKYHAKMEELRGVFNQLSESNRQYFETYGYDVEQCGFSEERSRKVKTDPSKWKFYIRVKCGFFHETLYAKPEGITDKELKDTRTYNIFDNIVLRVGCDSYKSIDIQTLPKIMGVL